jgi:hypothetical protein
MLAIHHAHFILLELIILIIFGKEYKALVQRRLTICVKNITKL